MNRFGWLFVAALCLLFAATAFSQSSSPWTWAPYLGAVGQDSVAISWRTSRLVSIDLSYSLAQVYDATSTWDETLTFERQQGTGQIWLRDLVPGALYRYQLVAYEGDAVYPSHVGSFQLASDSTRSFSFLAYGETRSFPDRHKIVADVMSEEDPLPAFTLHVGSLVETATVERYTNFLWAAADLARSSPYLSVPDLRYAEDALYYEVFSLPPGAGVHDEEWWSFDYGPVHLVGLDSTISQTSDHERWRLETEWLQHDLAANPNPFIVVFCSSPLYGSAANATPSTLRSTWEPIFQEYGVDVVVSGGATSYEHLYEGGIHYVVTGGGGAPLADAPETLPAGTVFRRYGVLHYLRFTVADNALRVEAIPVANVIDDSVYLTSSGQSMDSFVLREGS